MLIRFVPIIFVAVLVVGGVGESFSFRSARDTLQQSLAETAKIAAGEIETSLDESLAIIREIGMNPMLSSSDVDSKQKLIMLSKRAEKYGFVEYGYTNASGITARGTSYSALDWFNRSINGEVVIGSPQNRADGSYVMYISAPIISYDDDYNESIVGVVYAAVDASYLSNISGSIHVGDSGSAYIIDADGTVIAHNDYTKVTSEENKITSAEGGSLSDIAELEQEALSLSAGETVSGEADVDDMSASVALAKIGGTDGWVVAVLADESEFTGSANLCLVITAIISAIIIIISIGFIIYHTNALSKPIVELKDGMAKVADGDLNVSVAKHTNDEIGELASTINDTVRSLKSYVSEISRAANQIADGNFSFNAQVEFKGDFVEIMSSFRHLCVSLSDTLNSINTAAAQVNTGATQISDGAQSLAAGTTEQASSVDRLSKAVITLDNEVNSNAENAVRASDKAAQAGKQITLGNERMKDMIRAMENISHKSGEINEIIATIDSIAFQTNILALNAAIEAARAGEAGKGFAVVADEVRNLAAKSAQAAQSTAALIQQSIDAVNEGSAIADETADQLNRSVAMTEEVVELINDISAASKTQAEMLDEVNKNIDQIESVVQTNAAAAEESAASGEELNSQAQQLQELTGRFVLVDGDISDEADDEDEVYDADEAYEADNSYEAAEDTEEDIYACDEARETIESSIEAAEENIVDNEAAEPIRPVTYERKIVLPDDPAEERTQTYSPVQTESPRSFPAAAQQDSSSIYSDDDKY